MDCAPRPTPPNTSIYLSYFPQASEAFVARVFRSGFNAHNSPKSFLSVIYITTHPSVLFLWERNRTKTWGERLTANCEIQVSFLFTRLLHLPGTNILLLSYPEKISDPPPPPQGWKREEGSSKQRPWEGEEKVSSP